MIEPPPAAFIGSTTAWMPWKVPLRLTSMTLFHFSTLNWPNMPSATMPALFTSTLSLPKSLTAVDTAASHSSGWVTSRWT